MGLLTINELSGLGAPRPADPAAARRLAQQRAEDRAWLEMQRRTEGSPIQRVLAEAAHSAARLKRMDQEWLASQRRDSRSQVGRVGREAALARARADRERAATKAKLADAAQGGDYGWAVVSTSSRPMSPGEHLDLAVRRFKGLFYPQPKTWHVTPEGKEIPIPRVGEVWSREGVREAEMESWGPGYLETARYLRTPAGIAQTKRLKAAARARRFQQQRERERVLAVAKLKKAAAARRASGQDTYRGITQEEARKQREASIAWNARISERRRIREAEAKRQAAARAVALARRDVAPPAPVRPARPMTTSYRAPAPTAPPPVTRGLVTAMGPPQVARPSFLMMPR